jgi:hypothetical protein
MKKYIFYLILPLFLYNCDHSKSSVKPAHSGAAGEILVVTSNDVWNNGMDTIIKNAFQYYLPMLPQPEFAFTILHYTPEQFSMILERHRNIITITIDSTSAEREETFQLLKDKWAKEQLVLEIEAPSIEVAGGLLNENIRDITTIINNKENKRLSWLFSAYPASPIMNLVDKKFDIELIIPKGFELANDSADFMWLKREKSRNLSGNMYYVIQNLVIYTTPFESDNSFNDSLLLKSRDHFVAKIPGPSYGSYMTTTYAFQDLDLFPEGIDVSIDGQYGRLIRGLWRVENDFMGGPFISLSTYDEVNNRIITIEGEVFAPKFDKREYLRELEAIIFSLKLAKTEA